MPAHVLSDGLRQRGLHGYERVRRSRLELLLVMLQDGRGHVPGDVANLRNRSDYNRVWPGIDDDDIVTIDLISTLNITERMDV